MKKPLPAEVRSQKSEVRNQISGLRPPTSALLASALRNGFTLLELMIVLAIIGLLAAITVPCMIRARTTSQMNDCISNLRQVDGAVQQWAVENNAGVASPVTSANIVPYLGRGSSGSIQSVFCPADISKQFDNSYLISDTGTKPACQIVPTGSGAHVIN